jgi:hypothetical protein
MKKITIIFLGLFFIIGCSEIIERQTKFVDFENDWERDNLLGQVKTSERYRANVIDFESGKTEKPIIEFKKKYTDYGEILYQEYFDNFGKSEQYIKNEYNSKGQRVKSISENYLMPSKSIEIAKFNKKGEQVLTSVIYNDTLNFIARFEYDDMGILTKQISIQNNDTTIERFEYKYSNSGKLLWKKQIDNDEHGTNEFIDEFKYDKKDNLIEVINKAEHFDEMKSTYEYDSQNRIIKILQYQSGQLAKETSFDKAYNPISIKNYVNAELKRELQYKYKFDSLGNWTERKVYMMEYFVKDRKLLPIYVEIRIIGYYK